MEDGIERSSINYDYKKEENKETKYIYIFVPTNGNLNNYIIFFDKYKAIEYSQKNSCRVNIFIESENSLYIPTNDYYEYGVLLLFSV